MCGRYVLNTSYEALQAQFGFSERFSFRPRYNIAPSEAILTILPGRKIQFMRWGYRPSWAQPDSASYINARLEGVLDKRSFKDSFLKRRCLIPATGYFEWKLIGQKKQPYFIHLKGSALFALAGIWDKPKQADSYMVPESVAILTQPAQAETQTIHERQPLVIPPSHYQAWLSGALIDPLFLMSETLQQTYQLYPVSTQINRPEMDTLQCIQPLV